MQLLYEKGKRLLFRLPGLNVDGGRGWDVSGEQVHPHVEVTLRDSPLIKELRTSAENRIVEAVAASRHLWESRTEAVLQGADLHMLRHQRNGSVEELVHLAPAVQNAQGGVFLKLSHFLRSSLILL